MNNLVMLEKQLTKEFKGRNLIKLEAEVRRFEKKLGSRYIGQTTSTSALEFKIIVTYYADHRGGSLKKSSNLLKGLSGKLIMNIR